MAAEGLSSPEFAGGGSRQCAGRKQVHLVGRDPALASNRLGTPLAKVFTGLADLSKHEQTFALRLNIADRNHTTRPYTVD